MISGVMQLTYDEAVDALSIDLVPGARRARTRKLQPGVLVHYDQDGRLIELEILMASSRYPHADLARLGSPAEWLTLGEAATEARLSAATLRKQIHNHRLEAEKRGHDWVVSRAALWNYLESKGPQDRAAVRRRRRVTRAVR